VEIRDATQKIVFVGEYPAGTRQNVEGKAPFQVWIGKASGVRLFMGERGIDLKPHTREEVARFSLE
jgi:cytoskeleton protein RodZ